MKSRKEVAVEKFLGGYNCAQSVLFAFVDRSALDANAALKIATGFGAGMGRKGEVCGAVTGGILAIGARHGRGEDQDRAATEVTYAKTKELMDRFSARHGSCLCRQLLDGCDLTSPEGQKSFKENDLLHKTCRSCVESVADIIETLL